MLGLTGSVMTEEMSNALMAVFSLLAHEYRASAVEGLRSQAVTNPGINEVRFMDVYGSDSQKARDASVALNGSPAIYPESYLVGWAFSRVMIQGDTRPADHSDKGDVTALVVASNIGKDGRNHDHYFKVLLHYDYTQLEKPALRTYVASELHVDPIDHELVALALAQKEG